MSISMHEIRKILDKKIVQLNDIIADIDHVLTEMETDYYRVSIFGSARIKEDSPHFKEVYNLAFELAMQGVDIVTGGGHGLMQAANMGAKDGGRKSRSIGLPIQLPFENNPNTHLDVKKHHRRFSSRLDEFMRISHAVVVTHGGVGTLLEFFYTWQLIQVGHIKPRPLILLGSDAMWSDLIDWIAKWPLKLDLLYEHDLASIKICPTVEDVIKYLEPEIKRFRKAAKKNV